MTKTDAIRFAGSVKRLAEIMDVSHQAIYAWRESMPTLRYYQLQALRPNWFRRLRLEQQGKQ